jgi:hypothetical protein
MGPGSISPEPVHVHHTGDRHERPAALLVVEPCEPAMALRVVFEVDAHAALIFGDRCLAARAPRPVRLLAVRRSIKWHETFPRKTPVSISGSHEARRRPSSIWSQLVDCELGAARAHQPTDLQISLGDKTLRVNGVSVRLSRQVSPPLNGRAARTWTFTARLLTLRRHA